MVTLTEFGCECDDDDDDDGYIGERGDEFGVCGRGLLVGQMARGLLWELYVA